MATSPQGPGAPLPAGTPAPDFTLSSGPGQTMSLGGFRGRPVILAFYPADWSPVCGDQMALYNEVLPEFERYHAQLLGISVDGVRSEERRVGKECRTQWWRYSERKNEGK